MQYWCQYAQHELGAGNYTELWNIFDRCLTSCPTVGLWKVYLGYVVKAKEGERKDILEAYEFTLRHVGKSLESGSIWLSYIDYVKVPCSSPPQHSLVTSQLQIYFQKQANHHNEADV